MNNLIFLVSAYLEVLMSFAKKFLKGNDPVKQEIIEKAEAIMPSLNACISCLIELEDEIVVNVTTRVLELIKNNDVKLFCLPDCSEVTVKVMDVPISQIVIVLPEDFAEQAEKDVIHHIRQTGKLFSAFYEVCCRITPSKELTCTGSINEKVLAEYKSSIEDYFLEVYFEKYLLYLANRVVTTPDSYQATLPN